MMNTQVTSSALRRHASEFTIFRSDVYGALEHWTEEGIPLLCAEGLSGRGRNRFHDLRSRAMTSHMLFGGAPRPAPGLASRRLTV